MHHYAVCVTVLTVSRSTLTRVPPPSAMLSTSGIEKLVLTSPPTYSVTQCHTFTVTPYSIFIVIVAQVYPNQGREWYPTGVH